MTQIEFPLNIFQDAYLSFEHDPQKDEAVFGILELIARQFSLNPTYATITRLTIALDISGSMQDKCKDGRTKIEHMRFTLIRLLQYLLENKINVSIALFGFDDAIEPKIETQILAEDHLSELMLSINSCYPRNGTNIGIALQNGFEIIRKNKDSDELESQIEDIFILLTDGQPTTGITEKGQLKTLAKRITNLKWTTMLAVGCGYAHDSSLLTYLCNKNYFFVYEIERVGETIAKIVDENFHKLLQSVHISVNSGEIFNWRTGKWETSCACDDIIADGTRTFHVRSDTPEGCTVLVGGTNTQLKFKGGPFEMIVDKKNYDQNLSRFQYRQKTLELLAEIQNYHESKSKNFSEKHTVITDLKLKLKTLLIEMKEYMDTNGLRDAALNEESAFMNKLCDDVFIAFKTLGTSRGFQYVSSRQRSQGENSTFSQVPADHELLPDFLRPPVMGRQCTGAIKQMEQDEDEDDLCNIQIPVMGRQCSLAINHMVQDEKTRNPLPLPLKRHKPVFSVFELKEDEDELENNVLSAATQQEDQLLLGISCTQSQNEEEEEADDDFITQYKVSNSNPHSNKRTVALVLGMTSEFKQEQEEDIVANPRCGTNVRFV